jgi:hypothetical protein
MGLLSRRHFCLCCMTGAGFGATGGWLSPRQAFAEARGLVTLIKDSAASSPVTSYKLRGNVSALEGSGGNIETVAAKPTAAHDAKWGQFVIDPTFFTKLVYEGV